MCGVLHMFYVAIVMTNDVHNTHDVYDMYDVHDTGSDNIDVEIDRCLLEDATKIYHLGLIKYLWTGVD
jgi:hypothetical protein